MGLLEGLSALDLGGLDGFPDQFLEGGDVDVVELIDVEAGLANFVFAKFLEQGGLVFQYAVQVEGQVLLPWRESDWEPVALTSFAAIAEAAEADNGLAPHDSRFATEFFHQLEHSEAISAPLLVLHAGQKFLDVRGVLLRLGCSHWLRLADAMAVDKSGSPGFDSGARDRHL